ncbi:MAG: type II toxin-antitoxin system VapC family toxin [Rhodospirillales bacterium]|nr:type II toxin-antitoxin system VapC family toxin [Rhodospirillales bacterium]
MIVIDASIAIKWFISEEHRPEARQILMLEEQLTAPDLIVTELANIAWKKSMREEIDAAQARLIIPAVHQYIPAMHRSLDLVERALDIALDLRHPIYDCIYLACAERVGGTLITADRRLTRSLENTAYAPLVRFVADVEIPPDLQP